ncbi:MAG TPA: DUF305 domain-containing protein [Polyangiaceae bacterium]|nr:DUF305 domain-containing protein [Polyangiaceae bacterium]
MKYLLSRRSSLHRVVRLGWGITSSLVLAASIAVACGGDDDDGTGATGGARASGGSSSGGAQSGGAGQGGTRPQTGGGGGAGDQTGNQSGGAETGGSESGGRESGGSAGVGTGGEDSITGGSGGAGGGEATGGAQQQSVIEGDRRIPFSPPDDRAFVDFFIQHHHMAIDIAVQEALHGEREDIKELADDLSKKQTNEVELMEALRRDTQGTALPNPPLDPHADAALNQVLSLEGSDLDKLFLTEMIALHAEALPVIHRAMHALTRTDLKSLAADMFQAEAEEIGTMQGLLAELGVTDAGEDFATSTSNRPDFGLRGDLRIPLTPANDVQFIDFFAPHHGMAIEMADHVAAHGSDSEVKVLAAAMSEAQSLEVKALQMVRETLTSNPDSPAPPTDEYMKDAMDEMMSLEGAELDRMFLMEMIPHHASAIPTAHRAKPHVTNTALRNMSNAIFHKQAAEIGVMARLLVKVSEKK